MWIKRTLIIFAFFVAAYLFVLNAGVHLGIFNDYIPVCKQGPNSQCQYQSTYSVYYYPIRWIVRVCAHFNGLIAALAGTAVAGFTFSLWRSTHLLWQETRTAAAAAAEQAKLTRQTIELGNKEFIASHRPRIRVRRIYFSHFTLNEWFQIRIQAANIGETDATIVAIGADVYNPGQTYDASPKDVFHLPKIPPGKEAHLDYIVRRPWTQGQIDALKTEKVPVWLLGIIVYQDGNETVRDTSFVRVYSPSLERFVRAPDTHPEIDREYEN